MFNKKAVLGRLALFTTAIIWGSSFFMVKNTVEVFEPFTLMAIRFSLAFIVMSIVFYKEYKSLDKAHLASGLIMGIFLFLGNGFQTVGIVYTTPGKNAFLATIYCILVPFIYWFVDQKKPNIYNYAAGLLCVLGIGLVSLNERFTIGLGDMLTIISGVMYAAQIVAVEKCGRNKNMVLLTILQMGIIAVCSIICSVGFETLPQVKIVSIEMGVSVLYLSLAVTMLGFFFQNIGQKYTNPSSAAIILSLESVFGVIFSIIFYGETLTIKLFIGFCFIFTAVIISETNLDFINAKKHRI